MNTPFDVKKCVYKRGKYYWVKWYQNGRARYKSTKMTNKELALEEANNIIIQYQKEKGILTKDALMLELIEIFEENLKEQVENKVITESTLLYYTNFLNHIQEELGSFKVSQLTVEDIESYLKKRKRGKKLSVNTLRHEHIVWNRLLNFAVDRGFSKENLMKIVTKPTKRKQKIIQEKSYILSEEQIKKLQKMATPYMREIITVLYNTGMRKGELENLRFKDIDKYIKTIYIQKHEDGWKPKGGIERTIPINDIVKKILKKKIDNRMSGQQFVFVSTTGKKSYHYHKSFQKLIERTGVAEEIPEESGRGVHLLRHSFCSYLVNEANVPLPVAQEILGHQDIKTTMMYVHTDERQKQKAIRKFDFIREFQKLRKEDKSVDETMELISEKFDVPLQEVEDILIGVD